jgi:S1-C subfamily serine protease
MVLAIGNPLGLRSSVTNGIVSAVGRTVSEPNNAVLPNVIQTSAAINPGNSGGALVDLEGKVVGIPTLAATDPQLGGAAPGIGFAIPSSLVTNIAGQIVKNGHVVNSHRAYLGVELATGVSNGAVVAAVQKGGPAAHAGIQAGELITSLAGHSISGPGEVTDLLAQLRPGQTIRVGLVKPDGSKATVKVKLGQYPGSLG